MSRRMSRWVCAAVGCRLAFSTDVNAIMSNRIVKRYGVPSSVTCTVTATA